MATRQLDAHLAAVIERSRERAAQLGELDPRVPGSEDVTFPAAARTMLVEWLRDGGYADALQVVAAEDPELAVQ